MNFYGKVPKGFPFVGFPTVSIGKGQSKATQTDDLKGSEIDRRKIDRLIFFANENMSEFLFTSRNLRYRMKQLMVGRLLSFYLNGPLSGHVNFLGCNLLRSYHPFYPYLIFLAGGCILCAAIVSHEFQWMLLAGALAVSCA